MNFNVSFESVLFCLFFVSGLYLVIESFLSKHRRLIFTCVAIFIVVVIGLRSCFIYTVGTRIAKQDELPNRRCEHGND